MYVEVCVYCLFTNFTSALHKKNIIILKYSLDPLTMTSSKDLNIARKTLVASLGENAKVYVQNKYFNLSF